MGLRGVINNLQGGGVSSAAANHIAVTADFTSATWNIFTTPKHELDIGYEIGVEALTAGSLVFHCVWVPLSDGASVTAGAGGTL